MSVSVKIFSLFLSGTFLSASLVAEEGTDPYIPATYSLDRYTSLWEKSPFSPASVVPEAVNNSEWLMTGITVFADAPIVTLTNRDTTKTISLSPGESIDSVSLVHAEWSEELQNSFAVVSISGAQKRITFDQQSLVNLSARTTPKIAVAPKANPNSNRSVNPVPPSAKPTITPSSNNSKRVTPRRRIIRRSP